jgi:3-methylcrotonyl-CoA carboxylase alpha subunit
MAQMFEKILIANRGEIAVRVARTAKRLGIATVAVYSEADAGALHTAVCDEAYLIGGAAARDSYLHGERIIQVARRTGAQAIHPGYGFLSENAAFARACDDAGIVFVGPPAKAIEAMGSKSAAKTLMEKAGVPLLPGYHGEDQGDALLEKEAGRIGYPVLIKAVAGGGGKGMRVVKNRESFRESLDAARREAKSGFGDERVLVEKYLEQPRHVEVQVFADQQDQFVYLFERDCSVQRRHQKIIEEAPAPGIDEARRREMGEAALAAARAVGYVGAGTVEFIVDAKGRFYFMEMNTRLQVEHPVTELITGTDLVEWQLRVAAGENLPLTQSALSHRGHAFEARVYAEDPDRDFMPSTGTINHLRQPAESAHVRVDSGVREGDEIGINYDPMIAKVIVWDIDRASALRRLRGALAEFELTGLRNNIGFLLGLTSLPAFAGAGDDPARLETGLIERHREALFPEPQPAPDTVLALGVLSELLRESERARELADQGTDRYSPWNRSDGWRLNEDNHHSFVLLDNGQRIIVVAHYRADGFLLELPGGRMQVRGESDGDNRIVADLDGVRVTATVVREPQMLSVFAFGACHRLELEQAGRVEDEEPGGLLVSPLPGSVTRVLVEEGQSVIKGQALMIVEAMKMEHTIAAPHGGRIARIYFSAGEQVAEGAQLLAMEEEQK